ncbi:MAG: class I SAM-dependent methyltransferase, partial [Cytophagales bacterium]|nr:class I SAM-dependent methyltransferase [Cytophagales bacterium]
MKNTVNPKRIENEIEHGKALKKMMEEGKAQVWEFKTASGKIRWQNRVRLLTSHLKPGMRILEIGCGTGIFTKEIANKGVELIAIDISPEL